MNSIPYDTAVVIGRWQLPHRLHLWLIQQALLAGKHVVVVIGSAYQSRNPKNPFTWAERAEMLTVALSPADRARVAFVPVRDYNDDLRWASAVIDAVTDIAPTGETILVGHHKDDSSYYLSKFPMWRRSELNSPEVLDATSLRNRFFEADTCSEGLLAIAPDVPEAVRNFLAQWAQTPAYGFCKNEHLAVKAYRQRYTAARYFTSDAVVVAQQHVLLIRRGGAIGCGLYALPGGFVEPNEPTKDAAVRELREETTLDLSTVAAWVSCATFDAPGRSPRGRIQTDAHYFVINDLQLPSVVGRDDAKEALWYPLKHLADIEHLLFEDHAQILEHFLPNYLPR